MIRANPASVHAVTSAAGGSASPVAHPNASRPRRAVAAASAGSLRSSVTRGWYRGPSPSARGSGPVRPRRGPAFAGTVAAMHDGDLPPDPPDDDAQDPDRAAILARRKRFIAIALSGLATGAGCAQPQPCLDVASPREGEPRTDPPAATPSEPKTDPATATPTAPATTPPPTEPAPEPCLKVAPPPQPEPKPMPCLNVARPPPEPVKPQPCLKIAAPPPEPEPAPQACLRVARPPDDAPARPTPCLKVAKPR
jgi:hypothetical protein